MYYFEFFFLLVSIWTTRHRYRNPVERSSIGGHLLLLEWNFSGLSLIHPARKEAIQSHHVLRSSIYQVQYDILNFLNPFLINN
jgi:hypothetical protein